MWPLLAEKKFSIWDILTFSAQTFSLIRISAKFSRILQNSARIFNGILHHCSIQLFPVVWMHSAQKKRRKMPNFGNFLAGSISVSAFVNIGRVLQYKYKYRIRSQDPNNFSDTETRWLVCALANFFSRIAIVFQRAVDQNALLLQMVPIKKRIRTASWFKSSWFQNLKLDCSLFLRIWQLQVRWLERLGSLQQGESAEN